LLKKTLEKTVDSRFEEKLEKVKQELRLEEKKQSIVYEQQKDSFRRALMAMHTAEKMLSNSCEIATSVFSKYATARVSWKVSLLRRIEASVLGPRKHLPTWQQRQDCYRGWQELR